MPRTRVWSWEAHREHQRTVLRQCASALQQVRAYLHGIPGRPEDIVETHNQGSEYGAVGDRVVQLLPADVNDSTGHGEIAERDVMIDRDGVREDLRPPSPTVRCRISNPARGGGAEGCEPDVVRGLRRSLGFARGAWRRRSMSFGQHDSASARDEHQVGLGTKRGGGGVWVCAVVGCGFQYGVAAATSAASSSWRRAIASSRVRRMMTVVASELGILMTTPPCVAAELATPSERCPGVPTRPENYGTRYLCTPRRFRPRRPVAGHCARPRRRREPCCALV